jgi:hypothetical protein
MTLQAYRFGLLRRFFSSFLFTRRRSLWGPELWVACRKLFRHMRLFGADGVRVPLRVSIRFTRDLLYAARGRAFRSLESLPLFHQIIVLRQSSHRLES